MLATSMMSTPMKTQVDKVLSGIKNSEYQTNVFYVEVKLNSKLDTERTIQLKREIQAISITQDFIRNITDKIYVDLEMDLETYLWIYYNRVELFATLQFFPIDPQTALPDHVPPCFEYTYRCIPLTSADVFKQLTTETVTPEHMPRGQQHEIPINCRLELIDDAMYKARKIRINTIARGVKMIDMLRYVAGFFGFKEACIVQPDNEIEYTNFVIPPDFGITDIMGFLQNGPGMGVYHNGFCSYVTQGCWYIYPRHGETIPKKVVHFYGVPNTGYDALVKTDWVEDVSGDEQRHILIATQVKEKNWSSIGAENAINAVNLQDSELVMELSRKLQEDGKFTMEPVVNNFGVTPTDPMSKDDFVNLEFRSSNSNEFSVVSELGATQVTTIELTWPNAFPFAFHPATSVVYNYDHRDGFKTMTGRCEYVEYKFTRSRGTHNLVMSTSGDAQVRLSFNNDLARADDNI